MFAMPLAKINAAIKSVVARTHNMPEDMRKAEIEAVIEEGWNRVMAKAETYVQGSHIIARGGYFSTVSMGNWHTLCAAAGVDLVPSRVVAVINPVEAFDVMMNGVNDRNMNFLHQIANGIQDIAEDEIIRFDSCAAKALKSELTLGRDTSTVTQWRGWRRTKDGTAMPDLPDQRIVEQMMEDAQNSTPVWVRKWVEPVMMEGCATTGYRAAVLPDQPGALADDEVLPAGAGTLFPCEWRVFVKFGEVVAVGNYYPQIARGTTPQDEAVALAMVAEAKAAAQRLIAMMSDAKAIPHHPKYEDRDGFDPDGVHFSLDFLEVADESAPSGRRLVMIEGGPAHLRGPNWGAHPISFGTAQEPSGIALSITDIRPRTDLDAL
ncbi:hypothetical protein ACOI1H_20700 [Loktanella sp. DJP18]|uniref:hypothetical protein n=1 Tax=Loktanella sp. DJP18 TaxID=3409788 RepID=UPI003BB79DAE